MRGVDWHDKSETVDSQRVMTSDAGVRALTAAIAASQGPVLVLTGAGISAASGIAPFRGADPQAIWNRDVTEIATARYFASEPVHAWQWFLERFALTLTAEPNAAHVATATLERWLTDRRREFLLVTQNIDTLHERAGSNKLVKVHGSADRARCSSPSCSTAKTLTVLMCELDLDRFLQCPAVDTIPRCGSCGAFMRPHALWFGEAYDSHPSFQWPAIESMSRRMAVLLAVGTSFSVGVTNYLLIESNRRGIPVLVVDPAPRASALTSHVAYVRGTAEELLPALVGALEEFHIEARRG